MLAQYDELQPGLAGRIVDWAISETDHRHQQEKKAAEIEDRLSKAYVRETHIGQACGFIIAMLVIAAVVYLALEDKQIAASTLGAVGFGGIIFAFISGRRNQDQSK